MTVAEWKRKINELLDDCHPDAEVLVVGTELDFPRVEEDDGAIWLIFY